MEVYKQLTDTFDSSGWRREKSKSSKVAQNSFENVEILGNEEFISYDEIGTENLELMFGGLESEDGLIKNIFTYEDDDNEIHVDYITYDDSESLPEVSRPVIKPQEGGDEESVKSERSKTKNHFRNDKKPVESSSGRFHPKKKTVPGKEKNPHHLISLAKKKKKTSSTASPIEEGLTTNLERGEKDDSAQVSQPHKKKLKKFSKGLLRQFLQVPPGLIQAGKGGEDNSLHRVSIFVADLTKFATSYNKLANVLLQGQSG